MAKLHAEWTNMHELWDIVYNPMCFSERKKKLCKIHNVVWGKTHVDECSLLTKFKEMINVWRDKKLYRDDLFPIGSKLSDEINKLKMAYQIMKDNTILQQKN